VKCLLAVLCAVLMLVGVPAVAQAANYYVATNGSNANSGGINDPFATIQYAANQANDGDTVFVKQGTYHETVCIDDSGSGFFPITFQNYAGARVTIDAAGLTPSTCGGLSSAGAAVQLATNRDFITWSGISIRGSGGYGIFADDSANNVRITNSAIHDNQDGGIVFSPFSDTIRVDHNDVYNNNIRDCSPNPVGCADGEAITMSGTTNALVQYNLVHDNVEEGINFKTQSAEAITSGQIDHNYARRNRINIHLDKVDGVDVFDNVVNGTGSFGLGNTAGLSLAIEGTADLQTRNIDIYNNVLYKNDGGIDFWIESPQPTGTATRFFANIDIYNNTFYDNDVSNTWRAIHFSKANSDCAGGCYRGVNNIKNNLTWEDSNPFTGFVPPMTRFARDHNLCRSGQSCGTNSQAPTGPGLVDPTPGIQPLPWFALGAGSAAINTGTAEGPAMRDIDGTERDTPLWDIGAYERIATRPARVTGLTATFNGTNQNSLSWNATSGASGYYVYERRVPGAWFVKINTTSTAATIPARSGVGYEYFVRAYDANMIQGQPSLVDPAP
jgi:hypothetical protein